MNILEIRERFTDEKKLFKNKNRNRMKIPQWIIDDREEPLKVVYRDFKKLVGDGDIVFGYIIDASPEIYSEGENDLPATIIYSLDAEFYDRDRLKNVGVKVRESGQYKSYLKSRVFSKILPTGITEGKEVYITTIILCRKHLPMRILSRDILPVIVMPNETNASIVVPKYYWGER
jgi:hypothetical protein